MKRKWLAMAILGAAVALGLVAVQRWQHSGPEPGGPSSPSVAPRGVFLIVVDTLRPDRLSCYGYKKHLTPHIDGLADGGVRFTRANTVASWTGPSLGAMLTSLYPTQLGMVERAPVSGETFEWRQKRKQQSYVLPPNTPTLAQHLRDAGYRTGGFVNQPALNFSESFRAGFDDWFFPTGPEQIERYDRTQKSRDLNPRN